MKRHIKTLTLLFFFILISLVAHKSFSQIFNDGMIEKNTPILSSDSLCQNSLIFSFNSMVWREGSVSKESF